MRVLACLPFIAIGCATPTTEIAGDVAGEQFNEIGTAYFGGPFLFFADEAIDCLDVYWVTRNYTSGMPVHDGFEQDFLAMQFAFSGDGLLEGQFNVAGEAQVASKLLVQRNGILEEYRGRGGNLFIDTLDDELVTGTIDITFDDGGMNGTFYAEYCVNLKDN